MANHMFQEIELQIQKTFDYYKQQGPLQFIKRFFGKLGFEHFNRSLIFLVLDLKDIPDDVERTYSFHIATIDDIQKEQDYNDGFFSKEKATYRLRNGHRLFVLNKNASMVYFLWTEQIEAAVWWFDDLPVHLPQDMVYISGVYTQPEFRNRGIASELKREIFHYLKKEGFNHIIEAVHPANPKALRIDRRLGFREYQTVHYKRYWHIRHYTVQKFNSNERKTFITLFKAPKDIWKTFLQLEGQRRAILPISRPFD
jgi:GNAT superfamily N-acetyltransferase